MVTSTAPHYGCSPIWQLQHGYSPRGGNSPNMATLQHDFSPICVLLNMAAPQYNSFPAWFAYRYLGCLVLWFPAGMACRYQYRDADVSLTVSSGPVWLPSLPPSLQRPAMGHVFTFILSVGGCSAAFVESCFDVCIFFFSPPSRHALCLRRSIPSSCILPASDGREQ